MTIHYCGCGCLMNTASDGSAICPSCGASTRTHPAIREKTLLDEFAIAAPSCVFEGITTPLFANASYNYAAAMMAERARRDEMGVVKEGV